MAARMARIVAVILLAVASVEILEADCRTALRQPAAGCESVADDNVTDAAGCFSCAACEAAPLGTPPQALAIGLHRALASAGPLLPGICPSPYHPPR